MPYYKFEKNDIFRNTLKANPKVKFFIFDGKVYYNKGFIPPEAGVETFYILSEDSSPITTEGGDEITIEETE